jgi:hypothetical protein
VKDEPWVRMMAADELEEAGFQILEAANADVALKVLEIPPDEVEVLFTGVDMPGLIDEMAWAGQVHQCWPHVRLISSGYARLHPNEIWDRGHFIPKPYIGSTLVRHTHDMMHMLRP